MLIEDSILVPVEALHSTHLLRKLREIGYRQTKNGFHGYRSAERRCEPLSNFFWQAANELLNFRNAVVEYGRYQSA